MKQQTQAAYGSAQRSVAECTSFPPSRSERKKGQKIARFLLRKKDRKQAFSIPSSIQLSVTDVPLSSHRVILYPIIHVLVSQLSVNMSSVARVNVISYPHSCIHLPTSLICLYSYASVLSIFIYPLIHRDAIYIYISSYLHSFIQLSTSIYPSSTHICFGVSAFNIHLSIKM